MPRKRRAPRHGRRVICFGEVLIDEIGDRRLLGGAPFNVAFGLHERGRRVELVSAVGRDEDGERILALLEEHDMSTRWVARQRRPTGTVEVELSEGREPAFTIAERVAWDAIPRGPRNLDECVLYFGTLAQRRRRSRATLERLLGGLGHGSTAFCDVNLRPPFVSRDVIISSIRRARILKLNEDEATRIGEMMGWRGDVDELATGLLGGFGLEVLLLTRGAGGASLLTGGEWSHRPAPPIEGLVDTVGAGDAFSAGFLDRWLDGDRPGECLEAALEAAAEACRRPGATPVAELSPS